MIVIYAPHPKYLTTDGWGRRIKYIDELFENKERVYVWNTPTSSYVEPKLIEMGGNTKYFEMDFRLLSHRCLLAKLIRDADFVYAHTVHSAPFMAPFYRSGKIVADLHGVAPEEEEFQGNLNSMEFYNYFEERLISGAFKKIAVTQAMIDHYVRKYGRSAEEFLLLPMPCYNKKVVNFQNKTANSVIYAGGAQVWQNAELMMESIAKCNKNLQVTILSHDEEHFKTLAERLKLTQKVAIEHVPFEKIGEYYSKVRYGFILRDDVILNRVACPTKLIEYLSFGIVPIMKSTELGDFSRLGGRYVTLEDFIAGKLPSDKEFEQIVESNFLVLNKISEQITKGEEFIKTLSKLDSKIPYNHYEFLAYEASEACSLFPAEVVIQEISPQGVVFSEKKSRDVCSLECQKIYKKNNGNTQLRVSINTYNGQLSILSLSVKDKQGNYLFTYKGENESKTSLIIDFLLPEGALYFAFAFKLANSLQTKKDFPLSTLSLESLLKAWFQRNISHDSLIYSVARKGYHKYKNILFYQKSKKGVTDLRFSQSDVVIQVDNFLSGGLENVVIAMCNVLINNGLKVSFLSLGSTGVAYKEIIKLGIPHYNFAYNKDLYENFLKSVKPKVVIMNYSFKGIELCNQYQVRNIQVLHNLYTWFVDDSPFKQFDKLIDYYVAVSLSVKDFSVSMLGIDGSKVLVFPNGCNLSPRARVRRTERLHGKFRFLLVASYTEQKNILGALQAFHAAYLKNSDICLKVTGPIYDQTVFQNCLEYVKNNDLGSAVFLNGRTEDIQQEYLQADALLISSFYEGGPVVLAEGLINNLPIVTTNVGMVISFGNNHKGVRVVPAPFSYSSGNLKYNVDQNWIDTFSNAMLSTVAEPIRPNIPNELLEEISINHSYAKYVDLVKRLANEENEAIHNLENDSWLQKLVDYFSKDQC